MRRGLFGLALGILIAGSGFAGPARGEVVDEVVRMLDADVAEEVIAGWLDQESRTLEPLSSDDVIGLTTAGASSRLIELLMQRAKNPVERPEVPALPADTRYAPMGRSLAATTGDRVPVELSVHYRAPRDPDAAEDEQWHLFVYLDGEPVLRSLGKNWLSREKRLVEISRDLAPGRHVLRILQEKHDRRGDRWVHDTRVSPDTIEFEATPGQRVEIEVSETTGLGRRRAYAWKTTDGPSAGQMQPLAGPASKWAPLCEDLEANVAGKKKVPRHVRKQLESCVRWNELWPGDIETRERSAVRAELELDEYRPRASSD